MAKKTYKIPCVWKMAGICEVDAESLEDAIEEAEDAPLPEGDYISDSFEIDHDTISDWNPDEERPEDIPS